MAPLSATLGDSRSFKIFRTSLVIALAHFVLCWISYGVLLLFDFDVLPPSELSSPLQLVLVIYRGLSVPLMFGPANLVTRHLPIAVATAINSCVWATCFGVTPYVFKRIRPG
jgi:hypothetical protein